MAADRAAPARDSAQAIAAALQRYRVMANVVGVLLVLLFVVAVPAEVPRRHPGAGHGARDRARLAVLPLLPVRRATWRCAPSGP